MSTQLGEATVTTPIQPADEDVQSDLPFARRSCTFQYCPHVQECQLACTHPAGRGPDLVRQHMPGVAAALDKLGDAVFNQPDQVDTALDQIINHSMARLTVPKVVDYTVCIGDTPLDLRMHVLALAAEGYSIHGGVSVAYQYVDVANMGKTDVYVYAQAMVLYEDDEPLKPELVPFIPFTE